MIVSSQLAPSPGRSLPQALYNSAESYAADMDRIFLGSWLYAGHASRIPNAGDYFLFDVGGESLIVIRNREGAVNALVNVCRHRGSRVCTATEGRAKSLVCPYRQWVYAADGRLLNARLMPPDFPLGEYRLRHARVRVVEGLIFVCFSDSPPDFDQFAAAMTPRLRPHRLDTARVAAVERYRVRANWKLVVENSRECYHCGAGHPQYCRAVGFAAAIGSPDLAAENARLAAAFDGEAIPFTGDGWYHYRRFPLRPGMMTESLDGQSVAPLMGDLPGWHVGAFAIVTMPNLLLEACPDYVMTLRMTPVAPLETAAEITWLVRSDAREGVDYDRGRLTEFWRLTSEQDWKLCEDNQAGVNSRYYEPGPYGPDERGVAQFIEWYLRQLNAEVPLES
jgi:glycine betaine catabolism A